MTVTVLSPHPIVRAGVEALLSPHSDVVTLVTGPQTSAEVQPEVVLYDALLLVEHDTTGLIHLIEHTDARVLVIDRELRPDLGAQASRLGAHGYFSMGVDGEALLAAILSAVTGWRAGDDGEDPTVGARQSASRAQQTGSGLGLSDREESVLQYIAQGYSNAEIATTLYLSVNSIKTYIRTGYRRIGVRTRAEAVRWGILHGLQTERDD